MIDIQNRLRGHSAKDALDALYYAARYIKQAGTLHITAKNVFDDDARSLPSDQAKALAKELIQDIEGAAGMPAAEFSRPIVVKAVGQLLAAQEDLDQDFTSAEIEGADRAIALMTAPAVQSGDFSSLPNAPKAYPVTQRA